MEPIDAPFHCAACSCEACTLHYIDADEIGRIEAMRASTPRPQRRERGFRPTHWHLPDAEAPALG